MILGEAAAVYYTALAEEYETIALNLSAPSTLKTCLYEVLVIAEAAQVGTKVHAKRVW